MGLINDNNGILVVLVANVLLNPLLTFVMKCNVLPNPIISLVNEISLKRR